MMASAGVATPALTALASCTVSTSPRQAEGDPGGEEALNYYTWSGYVDPERTMPDFERRFGVETHVDFYASNEELLAKLQAGGTDYDVIVPSDYMVTIMRKSGLLLELDKSKIPNLDNLGASFRGLPFDPRNDYSVCYLWGTTGILYDTKVLDEEVTGWEALWNEEYRGRIGMLSDVRETVGAALRLLGYSVNSKNPEELDEAKRLLVEQKPLVRGYFSSPEVRDLVLGGELALGLIYSGDAFFATDKDETLRYAIPEPSTLWTDNMAVLKSAPHPDVAHEFINYILDPKVGAELANYTGFATPNEAAMPLIDKDTRNDSQVYPPQKVLERLQILEDLGGATREYERIFTEVKSA